ncbi:MAG: recombination mediator RecR [Candidatus Margulisiibacteriota bacterium]
MLYPESLANLISEFQKMPTIGPKSAERLAFFIVSLPEREVVLLSEALLKVKTDIKNCSTCFNITDNDPCHICSDQFRDRSKMCVVATPKELLAMEKTREFKGLYHVLGGVIAPLDDVSPEKLRIKELLARVQSGEVKEVIMTINPTVEGEATIIYLSRLLKPLGIKITRIAYGLPVGGDIDYADEMTLTRAFEGRQEV